MSRTVLTYPDLPTVLTPSVAASTYLPLAGGTLTGNLGIGVTPEATWATGYKVLRIGQVGALMSADAAMSSTFVSNMRWDGTNNRALVTGVGVQAQLYNGELNVYTAPSVAAGAVQTPTLRLKVNTVGTLTLTPDAATNALVATGVQIGPGGGANGRVSAAAAALELGGLNNYVHGPTDNTQNLGHPSVRWAVVYAAAGAINTSSREYKEGITPLDPALCYQAAKDVRWYEFAYLPPAYTAPEPPPDIAYDAADDNETKAEKKALRDEAEARAKAAHLKMVAETAPARHQRGFVFPTGEARDEAGGTLPPVPALFGLSDRESTTPQADLATLGAALQELIRRFEVVEAKVNV